ncbi:N-acetylmuramoyl-L-alanine amidase [Luteolibacter algae]|uniref:N-acetylmuramoyl-L-alanine amidase n=1 Tax=Luteolibacter algae TaxID=454151 RepID=A0ABW5D9J4_9BACT
MYLRKTLVLKTAAISNLLRFLAVIIASLGVSTAEVSGAGWDMIKVGGRDYVSVESIKRFYSFTKLTRTGGSVVLENPKVEMKLKVGGNECLMNNVKFVFSNSVVSSGNGVYVSRMDLAKLIDPVLRPNFIKNAGDFRTVILDAGHGGKDPGATNPLGTEANYNVKLAIRLKGLLEAKGFKVKMVRESDKYLSLQERVNIANSVNENAIFVSLHFNSGSRTARGIETFTLSPPGVSHYGRGLRASDANKVTGNEHDSANIALATALHGSVLRRLGNNTLDRGIKRARFSVLSGVKHPAVLFEGGFMSHPYEAKLIANESFQAAIAAGMVDAIARYRYAVGRKPTAGKQ